MAPPKAPKSKAGFAQRLTAKVGPLPVWGWAASILVLYFLYTRYTASTSSTSGTTPTTLNDATSGNDSGAQVPASGSGSPADNLSGELLDSLGAQTSAIDALTSQLLSLAPVTVDQNGSPTPGAPVDTSSPPAPTQPTTTQPAPHPAAVGAPPAQHMTQTAAGKLAWGGLTFTTKAAFDSWAKAHGSSTSAELNNHPQAKAIYSTLK